VNTNERWLSDHVIGVSVSESDDLLGLGFGREHLREFLIRVTRAVLRAGANFAYGGHFKNDSFTRDIIELISDEQREGTSDSKPWIGKLYNHSPWPYYEDITIEDEANYIDACRFIPITQELAGFSGNQIISDLPDKQFESRVNSAVVLSAMRQFMSKGMSIARKGRKPEKIPPTYARILVGGKMKGYSGILPGLYEEALYCLEDRRPLFILGGYGGAGAKLAGYLCKEMDAREAMLDFETSCQATPALVELEGQFDESGLPKAARKPSQALFDLTKELNRCRKSSTLGLNNGLSAEENKLLFSSVDTTEAAALIVRGLNKCVKRDSQAASRAPSPARKKSPSTRKPRQQVAP
jgi:hypothetical protein